MPGLDEHSQGLQDLCHDETSSGLAQSSISSIRNRSSLDANLGKLSRLPPEIRDHIWEHLLMNFTFCEFHTGRPQGFAHIPTLVASYHPIMRINGYLRAEVFAVLLHKTAFIDHYDYTRLRWLPDQFGGFLDASQHIRDLRFCIVSRFLNGNWHINGEYGYGRPYSSDCREEETDIMDAALDKISILYYAYGVPLKRLSLQIDYQTPNVDAFDLSYAGPTNSDPFCQNFKRTSIRIWVEDTKRSLADMDLAIAELKRFLISQIEILISRINHKDSSPLLRDDHIGKMFETVHFLNRTVEKLKRHHLVWIKTVYRHWKQEEQRRAWMNDPQSWNNVQINYFGPCEHGVPEGTTRAQHESLG